MTYLPQPFNIKDPELNEFVAKAYNHIQDMGWNSRIPLAPLLVENKPDDTRLGGYSIMEHVVRINKACIQEVSNRFFPDRSNPDRNSFIGGLLACTLFHEYTHAKQNYKINTRLDKTIHCKPYIPTRDIDASNIALDIPLEDRKAIVENRLGFFPIGKQTVLEGSQIGERMEMREIYLAGVPLQGKSEKDNYYHPAYKEGQISYAVVGGINEFIAHLGMIHGLLGFAKELSTQYPISPLEHKFISEICNFGEQVNKTISSLPESSQSKIKEVIEIIEHDMGKPMSRHCGERRILNESYVEEIKSGLELNNDSLEMVL